MEGLSWKQVGTGEVRIFLHHSSQLTRLAMRDPVTNASSHSQLISSDSVLKPAFSADDDKDRAFSFTCEEIDGRTGAAVSRMYAVRLKTEATADEFAQVFTEAQERNRAVAAKQADATDIAAIIARTRGSLVSIPEASVSSGASRAPRRVKLPTSAMASPVSRAASASSVLTVPSSPSGTIELASEPQTTTSEVHTSGTDGPTKLRSVHYEMPLQQHHSNKTVAFANSAVPAFVAPRIVESWTTTSPLVTPVVVPVLHAAPVAATGSSRLHTQPECATSEPRTNGASTPWVTHAAVAACAVALVVGGALFLSSHHGKSVTAHVMAGASHWLSGLQTRDVAANVHAHTQQAVAVRQPAHVVIKAATTNSSFKW